MVGGPHAQKNVYREPPLLNLLKDEEHYRLILDVSIILHILSIPVLTDSERSSIVLHISLYAFILLICDGS